MLPVTVANGFRSLFVHSVIRRITILEPSVEALHVSDVITGCPDWLLFRRG